MGEGAASLSEMLKGTLALPRAVAESFVIGAHIKMACKCEKNKDEHCKILMKILVENLSVLQGQGVRKRGDVSYRRDCSCTIPVKGAYCFLEEEELEAP